MKSQKIEKKVDKKRPLIIDERKSKIPEIMPSTSNPLRVINYVEVGDMDKAHIQLLVQELNRTYQMAKGGIHYFIPIRNGKIGSDIVFEEEWLKCVSETCEIKDGQIVLKNGAAEVEIIRRKI